jgi:hypothetical protein
MWELEIGTCIPVGKASALTLLVAISVFPGHPSCVCQRPPTVQAYSVRQRPPRAYSIVYMRAMELYPRTSPPRSKLPASQFRGLSGAESAWRGWPGGRRQGKGKRMEAKSRKLEGRVRFAAF